MAGRGADLVMQPAGVATTVVSSAGEFDDAEPQASQIVVVQWSPGAVVSATAADDTGAQLQQWGYYSAAQVVDDQMWFAVPAAIPDDVVGVTQGSWIGVTDL